MKKVVFIFLLCFANCFVLQAQSEETDCSGFKTGTFIIPKAATVPFETKIVRYENYQVESTSDGREKIVRLQWIDDCNYIILADPKKEGESQDEAFIRKYGGIKMSFVERRGDSIFMTGNLVKLPKNSKVEVMMIKVE